ncbi:MAG: methylmalonyl Co-A mutase-associated GTPase MeaB [Burkholderiaceae bacterium]|nr:methylmalonyl Co-A mutase-associated GTPase MeaB [Burkholderiaceae bacterium]
MNAPAGWLERLRTGDRRSLGRAITTLENDSDGAAAVRAEVAAHVGAAHVIGVTGPPGGGKSTLVAGLIGALRARGRTVAVVAIDPSSPITGGAVLGDRVRMGLQQSDPNVFIRSMASRGHLGGLARSAGDVVDLLDVAGFHTVIVETVGAGQSEVEITRIADTRLVVCPPGLGDDIQAIKAGILEIADAFVVSKADLPDAQRTERELLAMLKLRRGDAPRPPVLRTVATTGSGLDELCDWLEQRQARGTRTAATAADRAAVQLVRRALAGDAYGRHMGLELVDGSAGSAAVRMRVGPQHLNFNGRCHGGAIFSLADMALGLACNSHGAIAALVDGNISISAGAVEGEWLEARASEVSRSRKLAVYRVDVRREVGGEHVASLSGTVYLTGRPVLGGPEGSAAEASNQLPPVR